MAGSFDIFRKYQRSLLVFVAILAMLAFFVLPPILQMGFGSGAGDPVAVSWKGGEMRESDLDRSVAMRTVVNRFLAESAMAAGRDPAQLPLFPVSEEEVVRSSILARQAAADGLVVSDSAINDFLGQWTNNLVRPEQFREIIAGLRVGPMAVSQRDVFDALRVELAARNMLVLFQTGFSGDPPGWRWEFFRRLEEQATIEAVPVVVESLSGDVPEPSGEELRAFFDRFKDDLPEARSEDPGFREPHRVKFQALVARRGTFVDKAKGDISDAQIADFYEKNKATMFRERPKAAASDAKSATDETTKPVASEAAPATDGDKPANGDKPADGGDKPAAAAGEKTGQGAAMDRRRLHRVAFRQPTATEGKVAEVKAAAAQAEEASPEAKPAGQKPAESKPDESKPDESKPDESKPDESKPDEEPKFEPLENVRDEIRDRLAAEQADRTIDAIFSAVAADLTAYAEDFALWQAREEKGPAPKAPDFDRIAEAQGLEAIDSELVTLDQAVAAGGVGRSFEFVQDTSSRFGFRQRNWVEQMYGQGSPSLRPVTSRDVAGDRYISWKTEDQPEFTPSFEAARPRVEQAWKIVAGRPLARKKAEAIVADAAGKPSLKEGFGTNQGLEVATVGPFSWLTQGSFPQGTPPALSDPAGLVMPGEALMRAVFSLEPGWATVAFNEPKTICYAIRRQSREPDQEQLQKKFLAEKDDQRRIGMVAQRDFSEAMTDWLEALEVREGLTWKRQPRRGDR
jgi:hypothetical protein